MKKSKLSLCLTSGFVAAMSLAACSSVNAKDNAIVTIKNYNGAEVDLLTDTVYSKYKNETDGVSKFYNAILEALIRYEYSNPNAAIKGWKKSIKSNQEIKAEAENNVKNDKNTADENAKTNNTSYETEWENILKSHNCEDEAELLQYYIYQLEKEDITDKFFIYQQDSTLTQEWLGVTDEGKAPENAKARAVFPYHIRHVLASVSGGATNFYNAEISQDEAKKLGNTMAALLDTNYTFSEVAKKFSGDTGSGEKGGDVGIMTTNTSFVNEFKYGIYAFDAIYNHKTTDNRAIADGLGLDSNFAFLLKNTKTDEKVVTTAEEYFRTNLNEGEIQEVPYDAFLKIGELAETEKNGAGKLVNKGNVHYYPRNVLFNYYLNFHNPFVITKTVLDSTNGLPVKDESGNYSKRFAKFTLNGYEKECLTDEEGNIIIGVRSEHGIHFMIMEKSIYDFSKGGQGVDTVSLEDYYTTYVPSDSEFPKNSKEENKETYVNFIETSDASTYTTRAGEVKSAIKSFDSTYDYRLFQYILDVEGTNITINDEVLQKKIAEYIEYTRDSNSGNAEKTINETWRTYAELIALQYDEKTDWSDIKTELHVHDLPASKRNFTNIHPRCAVGFKTRSQITTSGEWQTGEGICYYEE